MTGRAFTDADVDGLDQVTRVPGPDELPAELVERAARMMFDKANPDVPRVTDVAERDRLFELGRDYWVRAVWELNELLSATMRVKCPCGWTLSGPARELDFTVRTHRCEKTYPWWGQQRGELEGR